jgi:hypothetical protein
MPLELPAPALPMPPWVIGWRGPYTLYEVRGRRLTLVEYAWYFLTDTAYLERDWVWPVEKGRDADGYARMQVMVTETLAAGARKWKFTGKVYRVLYGALSEWIQQHGSEAEKAQYPPIREGFDLDHGCHNRGCCNVVNAEHVRQKLGAVNRGEPADWREQRTGQRGRGKRKVGTA